MNAKPRRKMGLRQRIAEWLVAHIAEDPMPEYSNLDRMSGLGVKR